jgi:hypothetical protein
MPTYVTSEDAAARIRALGEGTSYRADLARGRFWWQDAEGTPLVVASCALIATYARSNGSWLMGHANRGMRGAVVVPAQPGFGDDGFSTEDEAGAIAAAVAEIAGATLMYRAPMPNGAAFLALYQVRDAEAGEEAFRPEQGRSYGRTVLRALASAAREGVGDDELTALIRGHSGNLLHAARNAYAGTPDGEWLAGLAERLRAIEADAERRPALVALADEAEGGEAT